MTKDFLESPVSAKTERNYKHGLKVFYEFYPKPLQMPFKERAGRKDYMEILRLDGADTLQAVLIRGSLPGRTDLSRVYKMRKARAHVNVDPNTRLLGAARGGHNWACLYFAETSQEGK